MILTFISDTHGDHHELTNKLTGGDIIIHSGDFSTVGRLEDTKYFLDWFSGLNYDKKIFISGNHDFYFRDYPKKSNKLMDN